MKDLDILSYPEMKEMYDFSKRHFPKEGFIGIIPSKDLNTCQYQRFLEVASPSELQSDIILESTWYKIQT